MKLQMNPDLSDDDKFTIAKLLNGTSADRNQGFAHPAFSILDWECVNGKWRQRPRWVEEKSLKSLFGKLQQRVK